MKKILIFSTAYIPFIGGAEIAIKEIAERLTDIEGEDEPFIKELIRATGVVVVHGGGFGQKPGTQHFRVVFLPPEATLRRAFAAISHFITGR